MSHREKPFLNLTTLALIVALLWANSAAAQSAAKRITLTEAQARAAETPQARAARLSVDAAKYHRQAVAADYFPKIDSTFANLHFNKFMGEVIQVARRELAVPLLNKDQTIVAFTVTQPITPLFKVKQAVNIARADEAVAKAKASASSSSVASNVEQAYFALLIAQHRHGEAQLKLDALRPQLQVASTEGSPPLTVALERQAAFLTAGKELDEARGRVLELTPGLNALINYPFETELELVAPEPLAVEPVSLPEATQQAVASSVEVVEAEQTLAKAQAAVRLSKLDYIPDIAVMGGYSYQTAIDLLSTDFSFIGVVATYNVFDFGKRERTLRERSANVELAQLNLQGVKAKVAGAVQSAFFDVERARRIRDVTRQLVDVYHEGLRQDVSLTERAAYARAESEMLQAEFDYRLAYLRLMRAKGDQ